MRILGTILLMGLLMTSCIEESSVEEAQEVIDFANVGDSLSMIAQQTLLANVGREMQEGGPVNTIDFCNIHASGIVDSLSTAYGVSISRISTKYRNPQNKPSDDESLILDYLRNSDGKDTVVTNEKHTTYYKKISIGMPACLKCHGAPETDIDPNTLEIIQKHYPTDKAKNYQMGDFRGAWKIEFK